MLVIVILSSIFKHLLLEGRYIAAACIIEFLNVAMYQESFLVNVSRTKLALTHDVYQQSKTGHQESEILVYHISPRQDTGSQVGAYMEEGDEKRDDRIGEEGQKEGS
ncbi:hypothetical protein COCNU_15G003870 [Cocos nucifera]|uniref:Uncharacterized protein n=1 Tax=Cocos nucifera TaxID=13894 RepID=A0A8K0IXQ7_COCNU|nr:hypothetical protein COCNU_15G003870 [Cocos nucifera]